VNIAKQGGPKNLGDKQIVALVAYLQRLGTDLHKAPPSDAGGPLRAATPNPQPASEGKLAAANPRSQP
jgi:hypothetical protein